MSLSTWTFLQNHLQGAGVHQLSGLRFMSSESVQGTQACVVFQKLPEQLGCPLNKRTQKRGHPVLSLAHSRPCQSMVEKVLQLSPELQTQHPRQSYCHVAGVI